MTRADVIAWGVALALFAGVLSWAVMGGRADERRRVRECAALLASARDARDSLLVIRARPACATGGEGAG